MSVPCPEETAADSGGSEAPHAPAPRSALVKGRLLVLLAVLFWSTGGLFAQSSVFDDWPRESRGAMLAFWRALFAGLSLLPMVRRPRFRWRYAPMALVFTIMNVSYLQSMALSGVANAIWLQATAPLWVFLLGMCLWREPFVRRDTVLLASGLAGVAIILIFEIGHTSRTGASPWGVVWGLVSGIMFGLTVVLLRHLRDDDAAWLMVLNLLATAGLLAPHVLARYPVPHGWQWPTLVAFGTFQLGLSYMFFTRGLKTITGQEGAGIGLLEPVLSPAWVYFAYHEPTRWWTLLGGALILLGLVARYTGREPENRPAEARG